MDRNSIQRWKDCIKQVLMVFKLQSFMSCVIIRGLLLPWLKLQLAIYSVDSLILAGIKVVVTKKILIHSCFLSISKLNTLLFRISEVQFIVVQDMALHLVAMISLYQTIQIKTLAVMLAVKHTMFQYLQVKVIQN